ncbi:tRNA-dihydrouridine synthase [Desulfosporosinus lacus]|uniref:2,4-dienoyl-CoA reductase n=1 Tax=Desulfosporosinus lacus DSM 15449 TaxID=1121420 RepID=A0A1M5ZD65_9FIRM|nr:NADH:flavin oxidoreductase [Desulfosporosinus lacus]SHI22132.1 2,4-dienoyl-CoA reductase [Desulfosporosinus lacus DSM 15449]
MTNLLFTPTTFAGVQLRNKIVYPPITTGFAESDGQVSDRMVEYYRQRASGGVGLIIVEPGVINLQAKLSKFSAGAWADAQISGMAKLAQTIKNEGARAFLQLCHAGPKANPRVNSVQPSSASEKPFIFKYPTISLSQDEILGVVHDFVMAATRAREAGFDGVELHAAHFYLLSSFLSPLINTRTDDYGGDNLRRAKIVRETILAIKKKLGQDFPVTVRYHGFEDGEYGIKYEDAIELGQVFEAAGADGLHISAYGVSEPNLVGIAALPSSCIPSKEHPNAPFVSHAGHIKQFVNLPIIAVGKITNPLDAERSLREGKCDLVAVGRAILVDPQWPNKIAAGRNVVRCIGCNDCINSLAKGALNCRVNRTL